MDVRMPDGTIVRNAPDDITQADLLGRYESYRETNLDKRAFIESTPTLTESRYDPNVSRTGYLINQLGEGAIGLPSLVGVPFDAAGDLANRLATYLSEKTGIPAGPPAPTNMAETIRGGLRHIFGTAEMQAPDAPTRYAGAVAEFAGAGALPAAKLTQLAAQKGPAIAAEVLSTIGGGFGSELGGDITEEAGYGRTPGELVGGLGGGLGGAAGTPALSKAVSHLRARIPQEAIDSVKGALTGAGSLEQRYQNLTGKLSKVSEGLIKKEAGKQIDAAIGVHPESAANIDEAERIAKELEKISGKQPTFTLAQKSGAPEMEILEQRLAQEQGEFGKYIENYRRNLAVVEEVKGKMFPKGKVDVSRAASTLYTKKAKELDTKISALEKYRETQAAKAEGRSLESVGSKLKTLRDEKFGIAKVTKTKLIEDAYKTAGDLKVSEDMTDMFSVVRGVGGDDQNVFQNMPPAYGAILRRYGRQTDKGMEVDPEKINISFREFHSLWKEVNRQYYSAARSGDAYGEYYLNILRDNLNRKLNKYEGKGHGKLAEQFREFNRFYREEYQPVFKEGLGAAISAGSKLKAGAEFIPDEKVVSRFFSPTGMDDFNQIYGYDKNAARLLEDGAMGLFAEKAVKNGKIDPRAASTFMRSHAETLNKIPDVRNNLASLIQDDAALLARNARLLERKAAFAKSVLAKIADTPDVEGYVRKAIADKKLIKQIFAIKDPEARKTSVRAVMDLIPELAAKEKVTPSAFLTANESTLRPVFNTLRKDHWNNAKFITQAQDILERVKLPRTIEISKKIPTPLEAATGVSEVSLQSQLRAATITKQTGIHRVLVSIGARWFTHLREKEAKRLMHAAIYDPDIAGDLAVSLKTAPGTKAADVTTNKIRNHLYSLGIKSAVVAGNATAAEQTAEQLPELPQEP